MTRCTNLVTRLVCASDFLGPRDSTQISIYSSTHKGTMHLLCPSQHVFTFSTAIVAFLLLPSTQLTRTCFSTSSGLSSPQYPKVLLSEIILLVPHPNVLLRGLLRRAPLLFWVLKYLMVLLTNWKCEADESKVLTVLSSVWLIDWVSCGFHSGKNRAFLWLRAAPKVAFHQLHF